MWPRIAALLLHHDDNLPACARCYWTLGSAPRHLCLRTRVWTCTCWSAPSRAHIQQTATTWLVYACVFVDDRAMYAVGAQYVIYATDEAAVVLAV